MVQPCFTILRPCKDHPAGVDRTGLWKVPRAVENREEWRKIVANSSVVPQRQKRLQDRWGGEDKMNIMMIYHVIIDKREIN